MKDFIRTVLKKLGWQGVVFGLLSSLPILMVGFGFEREFEHEFNLHRKARVQELGAAFARFEVLRQPHEIFYAYFATLFSNSLSDASPATLIHSRVQSLKENFPGVFEIAVFDAESRLIASMSDLPEYHADLASFGLELSLLKAGKVSQFNEHLSRYRSFLGPLFPEISPNDLKRYFLCSQNTSFFRKRTKVFIPQLDPARPWFVAWISLPMDVQELAIRFFQKWGHSMANELVDLDKDPQIWGKDLGEAGPFIRQALGELGDHERKAIFVGGYVWFQIIFSPKHRLIGVSPDASLKELQEARLRVRKSGLALFLVLVVLARLVVGIIKTPFSLKTKLLWLFLYTTSVPLLLLSLSAQGLFHERRQVLEQKIFLEQEAAIKDADQGYMSHLGWLETQARKETRDSLSVSGDALVGLLRRVDRLVTRIKPDLCDVIDEKGETRFHYTGPHAWRFSKIAPLGAVFARKQMASLKPPEPSMTNEAKEQTIKASMESIGLDFEELAGLFSGAWNVLFETKYLGDSLQTMKLLFRDRGNQPRFMCLLAWGDSSVSELFFRRRLEKYQKKWPGIYLAVQFETGIFPPSFPGLEGIGDLINQLMDQVKPVNEKREMGGKTWLKTGMRGRKTGRMLFACSTDEKVTREIREIAVRLSMVGMLLMILGVGVGLLISTIVLGPVGLLEKGMESMKGRDFSARVPVLSEDEFGRVSEIFNRMMESMADLEVARIVQDTFFPQEALVGGNWEVCGTSVSASKVGGDYFDYFPLSDGRWMIIIGDVSGHGVPAALVVGMAKALAFHPSNPGSPSAILHILNDCLLKHLQRKRFMTCFLGIFDPKSGQFQVSNAGHNYPFLVGGGKADELKILSSFLGAKPRKPYEERLISMNGMEALCLYTDGLIEALDRQGNQIGYQRFQEALPGLLRPSASETEKAVRGWFQDVAAPGPLADDITIVILQTSHPRIASERLSNT